MFSDVMHETKVEKWTSLHKSYIKEEVLSIVGPLFKVGSMTSG